VYWGDRVQITRGHVAIGREAAALFRARLITNQKSEVRGWREGCRRDWRDACRAGCEGEFSRQRDRPDRLSGHKTLLYLVTASHGDPAERVPWRSLRHYI
jgi:hypothetical protein